MYTLHTTRVAKTAQAAAVDKCEYDNAARVDASIRTFAMLFFGFSEGPRARGTTDVLSGRLRGAARPATKGRASAMLLRDESTGLCVIVRAIMISLVNVSD